MRKALEQFRIALTGRKAALSWLLLSALATATGPFGTFDGLSLLQRAIFWSAMMALGLVLTLGLRTAMRMTRPDMDEWTETFFLAILLTGIFTPILFVLVRAAVGGEPMGPLPLLEVGAVVILVPIAVTSFRRILADPKLEFGRPEPPAEPRIYQRLPEAEGQKIVRISVRDHYVEVVTDRNSETLLMRFSDAIAEAEGIPGLQVHRSHWVAEDAVTGVDREKGRMFLTLKDGSRVPVSRGFRAAVEEAGIADSAA